MTTNPLVNLQSTVVQTDNLLDSEIDDELIVMSINAGKYYGMDAIGARIWLLLTQPRQIFEICEQLQLEFDVDRATCELDVMEFIQQLTDARLVQIIAE